MGSPFSSSLRAEQIGGGTIRVLVVGQFVRKITLRIR